MMCANILVTGASGYIGGSITTEILRHRNDLNKPVKIHAAVRSQEQAQSFCQQEVQVILLDLGDKSAVVEYILSHDIDLVINNATSIDATVALNLIMGLKARRESTGRDSFYIHTTVLSAFDENTNWPYGVVKDTDSVYDLEKKSADTYVVRRADTSVVQRLKETGVTGFLIFPPTLHGRGTGTWNQLSPQIPALIKSSVRYGQVYKSPENRDATLAQISDLAAFYVQFLGAILRGEQLPNGEDGYHFLVSHVVPWWEILNRLAAKLHSRGLTTSASTKVWPSDEMVAESVGVPVEFAHSMWNASPKVVCEKKELIGWNPRWNKETFLERLDEEVDDFLELGMPKSSLLDSLKPRPVESSR